jgi:hypothetical protein
MSCAIGRCDNCLKACAADKVVELRTEMDKLKVEVERLKRVEKGLTAANDRLTAERDDLRKTKEEPRKLLAVLRNAVHDHNATNACGGEPECWCDDCNAEREHKKKYGQVDGFALPATKKARAIADEVAQLRAAVGP